MKTQFMKTKAYTGERVSEERTEKILDKVTVAENKLKKWGTLAGKVLIYGAIAFIIIKQIIRMVF